jgi:hypothetical protein
MKDWHKILYIVYKPLAMENADKRNMVPGQEKGMQKNLKHSITLESIDDAEEMFLIAKDRLTDVNHWNDVAGKMGAKFSLTDHHGKELHRHAHLGDYIKIDIPGPGNAEGEGFDWVHIDKIIYDDYPDDGTESIAILVRPCNSPTHPDGETAHFFSDDSTSTFIVERHNKIIIAHYYGRNEVPNTDADGILNKVRNVAVAIGGLLGISDIQWQSLIEGLIAIPG